MAIPKKEEYIFYQGEKFQIEFYFTETGKMPAKEYLEEVALDVKVKLAALVKYIAEQGKIFDITKFRAVDSQEKIYEFKPWQYRFFNFFYEGRKIIITNGYMKKSQKVNRKDLERARDIKKDYTYRVKGGNYYGEE
ncbi:MAG: type II toxin-antitoxin system RelE/ParE family toxin [Candidatus Omnitrophota bacterium]|nr:type II toxin-antitoxin system RelE/ParE family toxin [Candidatus Omnitrophota bacterium]